MSAQKTVLLVDDDNEIIESMRTVLEAKGYRVMVARDGNAALFADPHLPPGWTSMTLTGIQFRGQSYTIVIDSDNKLTTIDTP